jgi:hypothetical protein
MKIKAAPLFMTVILLLSAAACKTTETKPVSWERRSAWFAKMRDPRIYRIDIYQTPAGIEYRGGGRLHPGQADALKMAVAEPARPAVALRGKLGAEWPVLFDCSSARTWFEFSTARNLGALPVGEREPRQIKLPGEEIAGALAVIPTLSLGQIRVENPLVFVRLADGSLGDRLTRGIEKPELKGVIGWDQLQKFEQIQFDYSGKRILLAVSEAYMPNPDLLVTTLLLVKHAGACVVRGSIDGKEGLLLIDPAGDFELALDTPVSSAQVQIGKLVFETPAVSASPGGARLGARLLKDYKVTICPQEGVVHFEKPSDGR